MKRVLHIIGNATHDNTAICKMVETMVRGIDHKHFEHHVWFLGDTGPFFHRFTTFSANVLHVPWHADRRWDLAGALRFQRALSVEYFDIVHQHFGSRGLRWVVRKTSNAKIIFHMHLRIAARDGKIPGIIDTSGADAVIAISKAVAASSYGVFAQVVYPGIEWPAPADHRYEKLRPIIGFAGRLEPVKNVSTLIQAMYEIRPKLDQVRLVIAGNGSERLKLYGLATRLDIADSVRILGHQEEMTELMREFDVLCVPSLEEGFGMSALEAMSLGVPVVASRVGGLLELIEHNVTGWLFDPHDPIELSKLLMKVLRRGPEVGSVVQSAEKLARVKFAAVRMCKQIQAIYDSLMA